MTKKLKFCVKLKRTLRNFKYQINFAFYYLTVFMFYKNLPLGPVYLCILSFFLIAFFIFFYLTEIQTSRVPTSIYVTLLLFLKLILRDFIEHAIVLEPYYQIMVLAVYIYYSLIINFTVFNDASFINYIIKKLKK